MSRQVSEHAIPLHAAKVLGAVLFATQAHAGQLRKFAANEPYVMHVFRVATMVAQVGEDTDTICAAILHDVLEDCPQVTHEDIHDTFGNDVYEMVFALTDCDLSVGNRKTRKAFDRERLAAASSAVQTIKMADMIDNTPSIVENDPDFAKVYLREKALLLPMLKLADPHLTGMAQDLLRKGMEEIYGNEDAAAGC